MKSDVRRFDSVLSKGGIKTLASALCPPLLCLTVLLTGNSYGQTENHAVSIQRAESELSEHTIVLDGELLASVFVEKDKRSMTLDLKQIPSELKAKIKKGSILMGGVSTNTPHGLLLRVIDVSTRGDKLVLQTRPALLAEAFKKLSVEATVELAPPRTNKECYRTGGQ